jgi:hypothetical protein
LGTRPRIAASAALACGVLALLGSAGSASAAPAAAAAPTPTHAQFARRLDALCEGAARSTRATDKAITKALNANRQAEAGRLLAGETPLLTGVVTRIANLTAPTADRATLARYVVVGRRVLGLQQRLALDLEASKFGDATHVTSLLHTAGIQQARLALVLGAGACKG